jgi:putative hydrolase of the HAD superfamily
VSTEPKADSAPGNRIRGVLFDATGTLFDTRESVGTVYARLARPFGVDRSSRSVDQAFRRAVADAPPRVFPDCAADEIFERERHWWREVVRRTFSSADRGAEFTDFEAFFAELYDYYQTAEGWALRPGVFDAMLDLRRRGYATGVVSNFDQRLPTILQALEVEQFFDVVMIPARCRTEKPDPRIFGAALEALRLPARSVLYVGDDPEKDLAAARRAGLHAIDARELASFGELNSRIERMNAACTESVSDKAR